MATTVYTQKEIQNYLGLTDVEWFTISEDRRAILSLRAAREMRRRDKKFGVK